MRRFINKVLLFSFCAIVFTQWVRTCSTDATGDKEDNNSCVLLSDEFYFPVKGHSTQNIISYFGDPRGKTRKHLGVDIKADRHTPVIAVVDGKVEAIKEGGNGGKTLYLRANDGTLYYYAHLQDWLVREAAWVSGGEEIGTVGNSGNAKRASPHLHFEIMRGKKRTSIDPLPILEEAE